MGERLPDFLQISVEPGLCGSCDHARVLKSSTSAYLYCGLAARDDRFPRYPRLPVVSCRGYHHAERSEDSPSDESEPREPPTPNAKSTR